MTHLEVDLPEAPWLAMPLDEDVAAWARATASELREDPDEARRLAQELETAAGGARASEPLACAVVVPDDEPAGVLALLLVHRIHEVADVAAASEMLAAERRHDVREPVLTATELPLGPAVRWHTLTTGDDGFVMEAVEHVVPLGDGTALRSELSWTAVALGDALAELADLTAAGLRVVEE